MEVKMQMFALVVSAIAIRSSDAVTCYTAACLSQNCGSGDATQSNCVSCSLITTAATVSDISTTMFTRGCSMTSQTTDCSTTSMAGISTMTTCYCDWDNCNASQITVQTTTTTTTPAPHGNTATPLTATTAATAALFVLSTALILSL